MAHGHLTIARLEDGILRHFRAGSGGGGDGDEGGASSGERLRSTDHLEEIVQVGLVAAVGEHRGDALAGVDGGAAADGDDSAASVGDGEGDGGLGGGGGGLAAGAVVDDGRDVLVGERGDEWRAESGRTRRRRSGRGRPRSPQGR